MLLKPTNEYKNFLNRKKYINGCRDFALPLHNIATLSKIWNGSVLVY